MTRSHDEVREALGAYALGQLDDAGLRQDVMDHLETCGDCRGEADMIAAIAGPLRAVSIDGILPVGISTPAELDERIRLALPPVTRPSRRWVPTAVGSALLGAAAAAAAFVVYPGEQAPVGPTVIAVPDVESVTGVTASAGVVNHTWGLEIKLTATGLPAGEPYEMWVTSQDGTSHEAGSFVGVKKDVTINCDMSTSLLYRDAKSFTVVDASGDEVISASL